MENLASEICSVEMKAPVAEVVSLPSGFGGDASL
jgi:hypothetical protein